MKSFRVSRELALGDDVVLVTALVEPYVPPRTNCRNEDACPGEGGQAELERVELDGRDILPELDAKSIDRLVAAIEECAEEALNE